jgi:beta-N-acetylhexosaminidase
MKKMRMTFAIGAIALLAACGDDSSSAPDSSASSETSVLNIKKMSLREKVGQMFFVRPEALDTTIHWTEYQDLPDYKLQQVNKTMRDVSKDYPVGGMILYAHNIVDETQLKKFIEEIRELNGSPL